jgi:hypothetical protein
MKLFTQTLYAFMIVSMATTLVMTAHYLEKYRNKATDLEAENRDLKNEVLKYEHLYLKCQGDSVTERMGAHYVNGKIKFYEY